MKNLLYKEFKLAINPMFYLLALLGALLLIPSWPYFISLMYVFFITISNIFITAKAHNDVTFSLMLPVRRNDIVKARFLSIIAIEMLHIVVAVIFAIIHNKIYSHENFLLEPNVAFFGFALIMYAIFNFIFFTMFYKTGYKVGIPAILANFAAVIFATSVETIIVLSPTLNMALDGTNETMLIWKLLTLALGIVIFIVSSIQAYKISAKRFELLNL